MKKILFIAALSFTAFANAQWDDFKGLVYMKWGYQGGNTKIENYFYQTSPTATSPEGYNNLTSAPTSTALGDLEYKNKALFCEIEAIKKNMIFGMRFGLGLKRNGGQQDMVFRETTGFNMTFGYGFAIKNIFSIIPTVRYNWSLFKTESLATRSDAALSYSQIGGNQRGFGINCMLPIGEHLLIRAGYYYEWIFRTSKQFKGLATTPEVELYIPLDDDHIFGFAFKVALPTKTTYETFSLNNPNYYAPATTMKQLLWEASFSLPITGGTTTQIVTITVVE